MRVGVNIQGENPSRQSPSKANAQGQKACHGQGHKEKGLYRDVFHARGNKGNYVPSRKANPLDDCQALERE
jgi:hypothetical protein